MRKLINVGKNFWKCLKTAVKLDASAVAATFLEAVLAAVRINVGVVLAAYALHGALSGDRPGGGSETNGALLQIYGTVICGLILIFLLRLAEAFCRKEKEARMVICDRRFRMAMNMRTLEMDYQVLESPAMIKLRERIQNDNNWGCGFLHVFFLLSELFGALAGIAAALLFLIPSFASELLIRNRIAMGVLIGLFVLCVFLGALKGVGVKRGFALMSRMTEIPNYPWDFTMQIPFSYGKSVRLFGDSGVFSRCLNECMEHMTNVAGSMNRNGILAGSFSGLGKGVSQAGASLLTVLLAAEPAGCGIDTLFRYMGFLQNAMMSLGQFAGVAAEIGGVSGRQQSTIEYTETEDMLPKGKRSVKKNRELIFEFQKVSFRYPGQREYALKEVSLILRGDRKTALVGPNGSGKTTLVKLLARLYDPTEGRITLNGVDIREYDYQEYLSLFSVVFQDFHLFSLKLGENVAGTMKYDRDKVEKCLKEAGLYIDGESRKVDPDTWLYKDFSPDGVEISGGEAQKTAIARALYKNAPMVVLDEPTAALDPMAEYELFTGFDRLAEGKGTVYISHRMSACRLSNWIYVLKNGKVAESGTHQELKARGGLYAHMWQAQAGYYESGTQNS